MEKRKQLVIRILPDHISKVKRLAEKDVVSLGVIVERGLDRIKEAKEVEE